MGLEAYKHDMLRCTRCSYCKWIPWENFSKADFIKNCPSVSRYHWHAYAAGGKFNMALSLLEGRLQYSDALLDAVYRCQMDGSCDVACKSVQDIEPLQCMQELRIRCVEDGQVIPAHGAVIAHLRKEDNMMQRTKADRGRWAEGLDIKELTREEADVYFHAGCQYSFQEELWPVVRGGVSLLRDAGVDVGIMGSSEICCGGRAYEIGCAGELNRYASLHGKMLDRAHVKTVVTPCAHCYQAMKVLYDKTDNNLEIEILHITQYLDRLVKEGRIKLTNPVPLKVTYHDPCHLGRLAEPWIHWKGKEKKVLGQLIVHDPPKRFRRGGKGIYDIPRELIQSIPGLRLVEMPRIRDYGWCCGAGGGVKEAYPDFAIWTATERIKEAHSVGVKAIVSACPSCTQNLRDAAKETGDEIRILDVMELVQESIRAIPQ
jgi:Fe-S oxidoreductase